MTGVLESIGSKIGLSAASSAWSRWKRGGETSREDRRHLFDFATGLGQALIVATRAVDFYDRYGVEFTESDEWGRSPDENAAYHWNETERVAAEAEARLPRVQIALGPHRTESASAAVRELTRAARLMEDFVGDRVAHDLDRPELLVQARLCVEAAEVAKDDFLAVAARYS